MNYINESELKDIIRRALKEDIGRKDVTTQALIPKHKSAKAILLAKEACVLCGVAAARTVFKVRDQKIKFKPLARDGQRIKPKTIIACLEGKAQNILTAERTALNFLSLLSGIATKTRQYVEKIKPYQAKILDTRKTIPGLRILEKYAVRIGGGFNHRLRLDEFIMVKDNHLKVTHSYLNLPRFTEKYRVQIEVKNLKEFKQALKLKPDVIMLDNMSLKEIKKAVRIRNSLPLKTSPALEASGGITLKNVRRVASTGVEMISVGDLTHSVDSVDISLEIL
jgi:nicotinate-nucleotide pyrophosphorylase (carboxylating)